MAKPAASPQPSNLWKRYGLIALAAVVLGAVLVWLFWPKIEISLWLGELHSDSGEVRAQARDNLAASEVESVDDRLYGVLADPGASYYVRTQVGSVLLRRNRMPLVERALRSDDLEIRTAALATLASQTPKLGDGWFRNEVLARPEFRVEETLRAWLGRKGDMTRQTAVELVSKLDLRDAIPLLRDLTQPEREGTLTREERAILVAAARALLAFQDCETLPTYVERARSATDDLVRLRLMQVLYEATLGPSGHCKDQVNEDVIRQLVVDTLDAGTNAKHGALLILKQQPDWGKPLTERLLAILDGKENDTVQVRRAALDALAATGDEAFARQLPRYFHDPESGIRSAAMAASRAYDEQPDFPILYGGCWVGVVRDETESYVAYDTAIGGLLAKAGDWRGVPEAVMKPAKERRERLAAFRKELFAKGESYGLSRRDWADVWFAWWAETLGLSEDQVREAQAVRERFREAAARGDAAAAKKILEDAPTRPDGLFTYEEGWLLTRP